MQMCLIAVNTGIRYFMQVAYFDTIHMEATHSDYLLRCCGYLSEHLSVEHQCDHYFLSC